ncbi:MAG: hypothetical protein ACFFB2_05035 [Promethearchaeota archaeon]
MTEELDENTNSSKRKDSQSPRCKYCSNELTYIVKYCPKCGEKLY